jgi:DNA-binding transcriptional LysR family regulator
MTGTSGQAVSTPRTSRRKVAPFGVRVDGPLVFNNSDLIREAVLAGQGLAYVYDDEMAADIEAGRLTRTLKKWCPTWANIPIFPVEGRRLPH